MKLTVTSKDGEFCTEVVNVVLVGLKLAFG